MMNSEIKTPNKLDKKSEKTKLALITAGLELFSEYGVDGTSTRMIAKKSGVNISAISYYFESKDGLYIAVIEYIAQQIFEHVGPKLEEMRSSINSPTLSPKEARFAIHALMESMIHMFIATDKPKAWARIIIREQMQPTEAFNILYENVMSKMQNTAFILISKITGLDQDSKELRIRFHSLAGQIVGFLVSRAMFLRSINEESLSEQTASDITKVLHANIDAILNMKKQLED